MKISEPAASTRISDLPTPRLRARAMELYTLHSIMSDWERFDDFDLFCAFDWGQSDEGFDFWDAMADGYYDTAKELQPDLFKPVDGKPHIKLEEVVQDGWMFHVYDSMSFFKDMSAYGYVNSISSKGVFPTIQEAVDTLYSFKRATDVDGQVV